MKVAVELPHLWTVPYRLYRKLRKITGNLNTYTGNYGKLRKTRGNYRKPDHPYRKLRETTENYGKLRET